MALSTKIIIGLAAIAVIELIALILTWVHEDDVRMERPPSDFDGYIADVLQKKYDAALLRYIDLKHKLDQVTPKYFDVTYNEYKAAETELIMLRDRIALERKRA